MNALEKRQLRAIAVTLDTGLLNASNPATVLHALALALAGIRVMQGDLDDAQQLAGMAKQIEDGAWAPEIGRMGE